MGTRSVFTTAALLIAPGPAMAQSPSDPSSSAPAVALVHQHRIASDVQALPRLKPQAGVASEPINRAFARFDADARSSIKECAATAKEMNAPAGGSFTREVAVPMTGPNFLTVRMGDETYCGGAYPNASITGITYDLSTGRPVDWVALLGPNLGGTTDVDQKTGKPTGYLTSPALFHLWMKARGPSNDEPGNEDCRGTPQEATGPLEVWADAAGGGIAVQSLDVVHATAVCGRPAVIPVGVLRNKGVSARLLDSIAAGKAETAAR